MQTTIVTQPGQVMPIPQGQVVTRHVAAAPGTQSQYASQAARVLGAIQIVCGILAILLQVIELIVWGSKDTGYLNHMGASTPGIWPGILFIAAGGCGVASAVDSDKSKVVATMVLSIISCVITWVPMVPLAISLSIAASVGSIFHGEDVYGATRVINGLLIPIGLIEFGISLAQSIICCRYTCCNQNYSRTTTTTMTTTGAPVVVQGGQVLTTSTVIPQQGVQQQFYQPQQPMQAYPGQYPPQQYPPQQYPGVHQQFGTAPPAYSPAQGGPPQKNNLPGAQAGGGYVNPAAAPSMEAEYAAINQQSGVRENEYQKLH